MSTESKRDNYGARVLLHKNQDTDWPPNRDAPFSISLLMILTITIVQDLPQTGVQSLLKYHSIGHLIPSVPSFNSRPRGLFNS